MQKPIYLLDTNIVSQLTKKRPDPNVVLKIQKYQDKCAIPATVWFELLRGVNLLDESPKRSFLFSFLVDEVQSTFPIIHFDNHAAWILADISANLYQKSKGINITHADMEIASIAIANGMILVTDNQKHFEHISEIESQFMTENWLEK